MSEFEKRFPKAKNFDSYINPPKHVIQMMETIDELENMVELTLKEIKGKKGKRYVTYQLPDTDCEAHINRREAWLEAKKHSLEQINNISEDFRNPGTEALKELHDEEIKELEK